MIISFVFRDMKSPEREMLGECSSNSDTPASDQKGKYLKYLINI